MSRRDFSDELDIVDRRRLSVAAAMLGSFDHVCPAVRRYSFYRRRGYNKAGAIEFAMVWARNQTEQYERRLSHETGAEGWRPIGETD